MWFVCWCFCIYVASRARGQGESKRVFQPTAVFLRGVERKRFRDLADEPKQPLRVVTTRETRRRLAEACEKPVASLHWPIYSARRAFMRGAVVALLGALALLRVNSWIGSGGATMEQVPVAPPSTAQPPAAYV